MTNITIINEEGSGTRTKNVEAANIETHIRANDKFSTEAMILREYNDAGDTVIHKDPIAYKFNDPTEDARFVFTQTDLDEIEAEDPSLITYVNVKWK